MDALRIAARVAAGLTQPLSERPDYGTRQMISQDETLPHSNFGQENVAEQEQQGVIKKTPGKDEYCVKSEKKDSDWSGGCFPSKEKAEKRLHQVEYFKHKGSQDVLAATDAFLAEPSPESLGKVMEAVHFASVAFSADELALIALRLSTPMDEANDSVSKTVSQETVSQEETAKAPPGWKKTVEHMKEHDEIDNPFALAWYMKNKGDKPHKKK